jgi:protein required for attachment to host cells
MATDHLKQAYEAAEKRSFKEQDMLASKILEEIEKMEADEEWDALLASPRSLSHMRKMKEEIEADIAAGEIEEGGFDCREEPAHQEIQEIL